MTYSVLELFTFFYCYSFIGWCGEVCASAIRRKKFINRGFINGPLCPIYGIAAVFIAVFLPELRENILLLFLGGAVVSTVIEYVTGKAMEHAFHKKLWDYSNMKINLDGYICLPYTLLWGALTVVTLLFVNPLLCRLSGIVPDIVEWIVLICLSVLLGIDFVTTCMTVLEMNIQAKQLANVSGSLTHVSKLLENAMSRHIQRRMEKSFPNLDMEAFVDSWKEKLRTDTGGHFAQGCGFYKIASLFFIGAFLGDITEMIFCRITAGVWMSRSSVVYGPFSIVWGLGCALLTLLLYRYKDRSAFSVFLAGTLLGGAYEYICSVFTELVFGTIFWDYSKIPFNIGGRINLLYCFFWGFAAIIWLKLIYPFLSKYIEKLPKLLGEICCNILIIFMIFNMLISALALNRYVQRNTEPSQISEELVEADGEAVGSIEQWLNAFLDARFTDERMERIYPNAKIVQE